MTVEMKMKYSQLSDFEWAEMNVDGSAVNYFVLSFYKTSTKRLISEKCNNN